MGRYFQQHNLPPQNEEVSNNFNPVPGTTIAFHSSGGVHFIHVWCHYENGTAAAVVPRLRIALDGTQIGGTEREQTVPVGARHILQTLAMIEIPTGDHTLEYAVFGAAAAGDFVVGNSGGIIAIEFPSWEASDRISNL